MSKCINSPKSVCTISMHYANKDYSITSLVTKKKTTDNSSDITF